MVTNAIRNLQRILGCAGSSAGICHRLPERGDADERRCGLADPRHPQGHQPADPQGEDPDGGALHEGGAGKDAGSGQHGPEGQQGRLQQPQPHAPPSCWPPGALP